MDTLTRLQKVLEQLYSLPHHLDVSSFLTSASVIRDRTPTDETLFLYEKPGKLEVALFIDPKVLKNLEQHDPWKEISQTNLNDFCTAIEGISHFVFLIHRVSQDQPVRELELELQAEIDKYLLLDLLLRGQQKKVNRQGLISRLFERYSLLPHLNHEQNERYRIANRLAWQYCSFLAKQSFASLATLLGQIRHFYPLPLFEKINAIQTARSF
ncbi:MAG: hypothetical protein Q7S98_03385 [Deltaproteobacteria bacterium]|nr:hypothetical protein [Deltaproteobacteria bacterium]